MEIIEDKSRASEHWPRKEKCGKCGSKLSVDLSDLSYDKWKVGGHWFAGTEVIKDYFTFKCAACGYDFNPVDRTLIPVGTRSDLVDAYREAKISGRSII